MSDPVPSFILASKDVIADPYGLYDRLRRDDPVHRVSDGVYFLTRHADCAAALTDRRLSNRPAPFALLSPRHRDSFIAADIAQNLIAFRDAPDVTRARKALATEFMAFTRSTGPTLTALSEESVGALAPGNAVDFVADVAQPCALCGMCRVLGFPEADAPQLKDWSADFFYLFHAIPDRDTLVRLNARLAEFRSYTHAILQARRATPQDDLISHLARIDPEVLDDSMLVDNIMLLAADGVENVWAGMANALMIVLAHREAVAAHLANGLSWNAILAECLRLESPGQYQGRIASEPLEIGGVSLRKYAVVLVGLAAANRDPAAFVDPAAFRPERKGARDLAFGLGPHACLGRTLVNMQMAALFKALWPHLPSVERESGNAIWDGRAGHRWLRALPLRVAAPSRRCSA